MGNLTGKITIDEQRQQFLGLANKTYFNFGGQGTMPSASLEAIINTHQYIQKTGPFSGAINSSLQSETALLRKAVAEVLKTTADRITLTENVTAGCNIALWGIEWQPEDSILMSDCEHPGIIATVREIARRFAVKVEICPILETLNRGDPVEVVRQHLTSKTRLVVISHLLWNTGQVLPLKEIVSVRHNYPNSEHKIRV